MLASRPSPRSNSFALRQACGVGLLCVACRERRKAARCSDVSVQQNRLLQRCQRSSSDASTGRSDATMAPQGQHFRGCSVTSYFATLLRASGQ